MTYKITFPDGHSEESPDAGALIYVAQVYAKKQHDRIAVLIEMLKDLEWSQLDTKDRPIFCPSCGNEEWQKHGHWCRLGKVLVP